MKVNKNKASGIVWAVAIVMVLLLAAIPVILKAQGNVPPAGNQPPEISDEELDKIDDQLAVLMNLRHKWIVEGFPVKVADEMRDLINNFPQCLDVHHKFLADLISELDRGKVELVPEKERYKLPPRNCCTNIPNHVTCFTQYNGLIHGGIIRMPNGTLVCRAYRLTKMIRYKGSSSKKRDEHREVVVAGVCEKKNSAGHVVQRWTPAYSLNLKYIDKAIYYSSTSVALPPPAVQRIMYEKRGKRWNMAWFGYYFPYGWGHGTAGDNGNPIYEHWQDLGGSYFWDFYPALDKGVESPRFYLKCMVSSRFVINSAYLKVYHPSPNSNEAIVNIMGAYRNQSQRKINVVFRNRYAKWYVKTFR